MATSLTPFFALAIALLLFLLCLWLVFSFILCNDSPIEVLQVFRLYASEICWVSLPRPPPVPDSKICCWFVVKWPAASVWRSSSWLIVMLSTTSCFLAYTHLKSSFHATTIKMSSGSAFDMNDLVSTPHAHRERQLSALATNLGDILFGEDNHLQATRVSDAIYLDGCVSYV